MIGHALTEVPRRAIDEMHRLCAEIASRSPAPRSLLLTSPAGGEGTTTVAVFLGLALAMMNEQPTVIIDADFHNPDLHVALGADAGRGLSDWIADQPPPYRRSGLDPNLSFLGAGTTHRDTAFLVSRHRILGSLHGIARRDFEYIVWNTPPVAAYPDARTLASFVDGIIVVVETDRTRKDHLKYLKDQLAEAEAPILGAVMNRSGRYMIRGARREAGRRHGAARRSRRRSH